MQREGDGWTEASARAGIPVPCGGPWPGIVVPLVGLLMVAALLLSTVLSLATGSPRALLARDGMLTAAWACYMYASMLAARPVTFVIARPLLEGRRVYDPASRGWARPAPQTWDELWQRRILREGAPEPVPEPGCHPLA